jgi:hypothetical protein
MLMWFDRFEFAGWMLIVALASCQLVPISVPSKNPEISGKSEFAHDLSIPGHDRHEARGGRSGDSIDNSGPNQGANRINVTFADFESRHRPFRC